MYSQGIQSPSPRTFSALIASLWHNCATPLRPNFKYEPINLSSKWPSIRLAILLPGIRESTVKITLVHIAFADRPRYEALYYTCMLILGYLVYYTNCSVILSDDGLKGYEEFDIVNF